MILSRDAILSAPIQTREVAVPEWGGSVRVRSLSAKARKLTLDAIYANQSAIEAYREDQAKPLADQQGLAPVEELDADIMAILYTIVDGDLEPLFTMADYDRFAALSFDSIRLVYSATRELQAGLATPAEQKKVSSLPGKALPLPARARVRSHRCRA